MIDDANDLPADFGCIDGMRDPRDARIAELEAALRRLSGDELYSINGASWHDVGSIQRGVQAVAKAALEEKTE